MTSYAIALSPVLEIPQSCTKPSTYSSLFSAAGVQSSLGSADRQSFHKGNKTMVCVGGSLGWLAAAHPAAAQLTGTGHNHSKTASLKGHGHS